MSFMNNRDTMAQYMGNVWLTKPQNAVPRGNNLGINVCVEQDGHYFAVEFLELSPDGVYYRKDKPIGRLEDDAFRQFIKRTVGANGLPEQDLFDRVVQSYGTAKSIRAVAQALGLSKNVSGASSSPGAYTPATSSPRLPG